MSTNDIIDHAFKFTQIAFMLIAPWWLNNKLRLKDNFKMFLELKSKVSLHHEMLKEMNETGVGHIKYLKKVRLDLERENTPEQIKSMRFKMRLVYEEFRKERNEFRNQRAMLRDDYTDLKSLLKYVSKFKYDKELIEEVTKTIEQLRNFLNSNLGFEIPNNTDDLDLASSPRAYTGKECYLELWLDDDLYDYIASQLSNEDLAHMAEKKNNFRAA